MARSDGGSILGPHLTILGQPILAPLKPKVKKLLRVGTWVVAKNGQMGLGQPEENLRHYATWGEAIEEALYVAKHQEWPYTRPHLPLKAIMDHPAIAAIIPALLRLTQGATDGARSERGC